MKMTEHLPGGEAVPLYYEPASLADARGESTLSSESMRENTNCLMEVRDALKEMRPDGTWDPAVYETLMETYGMERTAFALYTALGTDILSEGISEENRNWAVGLYAPYYFKNGGAPARYPEYRDLTYNPARLDAFVTGFREFFGEDLNLLSWQHERGEPYPDLITSSLKDSDTGILFWKTLYSDKLNLDCTRELSYLADSVMGNEAEKNRLCDILDEFGITRTFSVLISSALDTFKGSLSPENIRWVYQRGNEFCGEVKAAEAETEESLLKNPAGLDRLLTNARPLYERAKEIDGRYETAYLYGTPVLYSEERIRDYEIPEHFSCYELAVSDAVPERLSLTEKAPGETFAGTVLTFVPVPVPSSGSLSLTGTGFLLSGSDLTPSGLMNLLPAVGSGPIERELEEGLLLENEKRLLGREAPGKEALFGVYRKKESGRMVPSCDAVYEEPDQVKGEDYAMIYFGDLTETEKSPEVLFTDLNQEISENRIHPEKNDSVRQPGGSFSEHVGSGDVLMMNLSGCVQSFSVREYRKSDPTGEKFTETEFLNLPDFASERRALTCYTQTHQIEPAGVPFEKAQEKREGR